MKDLILVIETLGLQALEVLIDWLVNVLSRMAIIFVPVEVFIAMGAHLMVYKYHFNLWEGAISFWEDVVEPYFRRWDSNVGQFGQT